MPELELQLREDRMLRDAARALVLADIAHLKRELDPDSSSGPDVTSRARDLADDTRDYVTGHRFQLGAVIGALVAAIALWIFREPLAAMVREMFADDEESNDEAEGDRAEQADDTERSQDEPEIPAETQA